MDITKYLYFGNTMPESIPMDIRMGSSFLYALIRHKDSTFYTYGVFKISPSTMVVSSNVAPSTTAIKATTANMASGI